MSTGKSSDSKTDDKDESKENKETIYKFYSFKDRDFTFKYVRRLWANSSSYANSEDEVSEESEEDQSQATARKSIAAETNKKVSLEKSSIVEKSLIEEEKLNLEDPSSPIHQGNEDGEDSKIKKSDSGVSDIGLAKSERYESVNSPRGAEEEIKVDYITK